MSARELASDGLILAGISGIVFGAWQVYPPAGWIVGGALSVLFGVLTVRGLR